MYVLGYELRCTIHCAYCASQHFQLLFYTSAFYYAVCGLPHSAYSSILFHKLQYYRERVTAHEMCVLCVSTILPETFLL